MLAPGSRTTTKVPFNLANQFRERLKDEELVTSFSVWYEDVFGRKFRTRSVVTYGGRAQPRVLVREQFAVEAMPNPDSTIGQLGSIEMLAFGRPVPYSPLWEDLYPRRRVAQCVGVELPGNEFTLGTRIRLLDLDFWGDASPTLSLQVRKFSPFTIWLAKDDTRPGGIRPRIHFDRSIAPQGLGIHASYSRPTDEELTSSGLARTTDWEEQVAELYRLVIKQVRERT